MSRFVKLGQFLRRPDSTRLHHPPPSLANCGTVETGEIFRAGWRGLAGVGVTRDALEGLKRPHFRFWSLISIFECHVCAKGGSGPLTGPCSVGKEATRGIPESRPGLPWRSGLARSGPGTARAWIQVSARERGIPLLDGVFPARAENPNRRHRLRHTPDLGLATGR